MPFYPDVVLRVLFVFVRISGLLVAAPFFGSRYVPVRVKVLFGFVLALLVAFTLPTDLPDHATHPVGLVYYLMIEALTGLMLGYAAQFIFYTVQFASEIIGFQMGLSMAQVYNPIDGTQANSIGQLYLMVLLLLFLLLDGHHTLFRALVGSFEVVPLGGAELSFGGPVFLSWTGRLFRNAMQLAAPFMIAIFLIDIALGIFARVVPQAELFSLSLPIKLMAGIFLLVVIAPNLLPPFAVFIDQIGTDLLALLEVIVPQ